MRPKLLAPALFAGLLAASRALAGDAVLPEYQVVGDLSGELKSVGSDTLKDLMQAWAEAFRAKYPKVKIDVKGEGSATAPPALLDGSAQLGPMSRPMAEEESDAFRKKYGYPASHVDVALDALAVYVNKANPIKCLSEPELDRIFSSTHKNSGGRSIDTWDQAGLTGDWAGKPIALFGRNTVSGTFEFFRQHVLYGGDYKTSVKQQSGSAAVVEGVAGDRFAIGYSGIGYRADGVRPVPVSVYEGADCVDTSAESVRAGKYPIARYLTIYLNRKPQEALDPVRAEFIKFIVSKDGQTITEKVGFYAISAADRERGLVFLGIAH